MNQLSWACGAISVRRTVYRAAASKSLCTNAAAASPAVPCRLGRPAKSAASTTNIADIHAERPLKGYLVYSMAKAGLVALTRSLAIELAPEVRVNAVAPGAIAWRCSIRRSEPSIRTDAASGSSQVRPRSSALTPSRLESSGRRGLDVRPIICCA